MAATQTVVQDLQFCKSDDALASQGRLSPSIPMALRPRRGVVVLNGYGISVRVERGHLIIEDGIGSERYRGRFSRVGYGLERLVVVGSDGVVSLAALRWLADQNASFIMLERDGTVLATTGPVSSSDVRLRRAHALALQSGVAFRISRELIDRKLAGQERIARESMRDHEASTLIRQLRSELAEVESIDAIRFIESRAAKAYWKAWKSIAIAFPEKELPRVPEHWRSFGARVSPLSGSPRVAANPVNALLNYLYAVLEAECRIAVATLGLDPEMGVLHMDTPNRDSLACDLMEPIRPDVDAYVLHRILRQPLKRNWFFEERNGNCRLMAEMVSQLAVTASAWARLVAPLAEWVVKEIASTTRTRSPVPATRLTQNHKRALSARTFSPTTSNSVRLPNVCRGCGDPIGDATARCPGCSLEALAPRFSEAASQGRAASHTSEAETKRSETLRAKHAARKKWSPSDQPSWLTEDFYAEKMQPLLAALPNHKIAQHLAVSIGYAAEIRRGRVPHPQHWQGLARLLGLSQ